MVLSNDDVSFLKVLNTCRTSTSEHDKGNRFERLIQAYLLTDPKFSDRLVKVWLWNEFPYRAQFGAHDLGIDLVGLTDDDEYWAIQCKCYQEDTPIDKPKVDSFLSTSGRSFRDESQRQISFSHRFWVSTSNKWGPHAQETLLNQNPPVTRINLYDLQEAPVDWGKLERGVFGDASRRVKKNLFPHQKIALEQAHEYFKSHDRGKLIMACGTGKTFTSLRIAENETDGDGLILLLVPSIALLGQSLREWSADAKEPIHPICICSDPQVTKARKKQEDLDLFSVIDLAWPASTNVTGIVRQLKYIRSTKKKGLTVVFSTYQSIEVISKAQKRLASEDSGFGTFDLIICDEAHRTTGVALTPEDSSDFIKVHDNTFLEARKRLYMTATPRLYSDEAKGKAAQAEAILCSMDDEKIYGEEFYRIGFGEAVERDLLSDYKVLILTLSDKDIPPAIQTRIANKEQEINFDDATKLIGCINALSKQVWGDGGILRSVDSEPMKKAVAFCQSIKISKKITETFNSTTDLYVNALPKEKREQMVSIEAKHIDGTMNAPFRDGLLGWLKTGGEDGSKTCHILSNVRCLSEGVDVPSLDAVMFLSARNSHVDVVQSVGRVMRKSPGKKYGYIIIPVVVPSDVDPSRALDDNERYKVVWMVLNALRAHDDRFNAIVNKIELNKKPPPQILVGGTGVKFDGDEPVIVEPTADSTGGNELGRQLAMQFEQLQGVVFARMVQKVGDRRYWEQWAQSVAEIAERHVERISRLITVSGDHRAAFDEFLNGLQKNINPSITQTEAVEMLSQHIITKPVFEALFENYSFVKSNPISVSMQTMLDLLEAQAIEKDTAVLYKFYASVRKRAEGLDNAEARQKIIIELYDKFFKTAFPRMVERLGIVFTPVEIVDFINHSVSDILMKEFGRSLSDENIHILDPFTGTGTFIVRMIQSGLISKEDLLRKYQNEIHANEIVLLAYYIAAINIENAFHDALGDDSYRAFDGICLTDTFQLGETDASEKLFSWIFPQNSERVQKQKKAPLRVIVGNPPYSVGQRNANFSAQNQQYGKLEARINSTYVAELDSNTLKQSLYDTYLKAFRWSTDRLDSHSGGVICFVTNAGWIDGNAASGFRKCIEKEFSSIYVFNTRGNARTQGELRRREAGNVFGAGSRTPIAITLLVKKPQHKGKATIYYHDIGDYLSREEKLSLVKSFSSVENPAFKWQRINPNEHGDWINSRSSIMESFYVMSSKKCTVSNTMFLMHSAGVISHRDAWVYNYSKHSLIIQMKGLIQYYNEQVTLLSTKRQEGTKSLVVESFVGKDPSRIKWNKSLYEDADRCIVHNIMRDDVVIGMYRPFMKQWYYYNKDFNWSRYLQPRLFPSPSLPNYVICVTGIGAGNNFSTLLSNAVPNMHFLDTSVCFPLYFYEERKQQSSDIFDSPNEKKYIRRDAVTDFILKRSQEMYGHKVSKEDIFYYVYGFLHSPEYKKIFANDLKKMLPRIPLVEESSEFWAFSKAGRELADLHINYESVSPYPEVEVVGSESGNYRVEKMRFPKKGQKDTIIYNSHLRIENIPGRAYDYVVNGKSAIEWIMERYQVTVHSESGIKNDPNDWADEVGNPRYILDLLLSIINVSVQTMEIVDGLPKLKFE